jgi:hypothetical protein
LQEFINLITPYLNKKEISIIELGWNNHRVEGVVSLKNATDPKQAAYIMQDSLLHVGPENFLTHLASFYGKPFVALFSNTTPGYSMPKWSGDDPTAYLRELAVESDRGNDKPSFSGEEKSKSVNRISAEEVAGKCLSLLGIENSFSNIKPVFIGKVFHSPCIEAIPNFTPPADFFTRALINLRLDYHFNEDLIPLFANNKKITIVTDREVKISILNSIKPNMEAIFLQVDESTNPEYIKALKALGLKVMLIAKKSANMSDTRLHLLDWIIEEEISVDKKSLDNHQEICDTTRYKSCKMLFSENKKYSSKSAWLSQVESHEDQMIIDNPDFWNESDYFKLYNINDQ